MTTVGSVSPSFIPTTPLESDLASPPVDVDSSTLPGPMDNLIAGGDPGAAIAALIMKSADQQKKTSQATRDAEAAVEDQEDQAQIDQLHAQASDIRTAGVCKGLGDIGGGLGTAGSGAFTLDGSKGAASLSEGGGKIGSGLGQLAGTSYDGAAKHDEADAKTHETAAAHAKHLVETSDDDVKDARELFKKALDFYHEYATSKAQSDAAALHRS